MGGAAWAAPKKDSGKTLQEDIPRKVLVLYDSVGGRNADDNIIAQGFHLVFDHYGLVPYYRDIQFQGLPDEAQMADTCAIVTNLSQNSVRKPRPYLPWLLKQIQAGKKVMILGFLGASIIHGADPGEVEQMSQDVFKELGVQSSSKRGLDLRRFRYATRAKGFMDFERSLQPQPEVSLLFEAKSPAVKTYLSLAYPDRPGKDYPVVFTGPAGGFAAENDIYWEEPFGRPRRKWFLDPFAFVEAALGLKGRIAPDVSTLNGLRIAFSHVDADGFAGFTRVEQSALCAEVLRDRIYKRFNFPVTLSLIVADVDPKIAADAGKAKKAQAVARELFAMPNVEPGSHTYSHPFYWDVESKTRTSYERQLPYEIGRVSCRERVS
jgi:hypothetical protein